MSTARTHCLILSAAILSCVLLVPTVDGSVELWPAVKSPLESGPELENRIDYLLAQMSVEQKVGQIIQPEIKYIEPADVRDYHLGSVLNGGGTYPNNKKHSGPRDWLALADALYHASMDTSNGGIAIPLIWGTDAVHGNSGVFGATLFPHNIGLGATRNPELIRRIGEITAMEVSASGLGWTFAPTVAVARDDRWGRTYESYSEDPQIVSQYAKQVVEGLQGVPNSGGFLGPGRILATAKHFLGDGGTLGGQDRGNTLASEAELVRLHAPGYIEALKAGVQTVMVSYSSWQGARMHGHKHLLTDVLKQRMGFDGVLISDWNGFEHVPGCTTESCASAINAGIDILMSPQDWRVLWLNTVEQVKRGDIPMSRVDDAVRRILRVKLRARLFEKGAPSTWPYASKTDLVGSAEHRAIARHAVRESQVLLKNNGQLLPLPPQSRVLVTGPGADNIAMQSGGWTMTWQGTDNPNSDFPGATSIFEGIEAHVSAAGGEAILSADGSYSARPDVAIVVWGEEPYAEYEGDLRFIQFKPGKTAELDLLRQLKASGIPVVSVFLSGRPLWINPHLNASDALVAAWLPGSEGGGVADVLFRTAEGNIAYDFNGRLSFSWPARVDQTDLNIHSQPYEPLFAYGYGLSVRDEVVMADVEPVQGLTEEDMRLTDLDVLVEGLHQAWRTTVSATAKPGESHDPQNTRSPGPLVRMVQTGKIGGGSVEDTIHVAWQGGAGGFAWVTTTGNETASPAALDVTRYVVSDGALKFDLMLESGDPAGLQIAMACLAGGAECGGIIDLAPSVSTRTDMGQWRSFEIELECFAQRGMDFTGLTAPFGVASDRPLNVSVANIRIVAGPGDAMPADCELESFVE